MNKRVPIIIIILLLIFSLVIIFSAKDNNNTSNKENKVEKEVNYLVIDNDSIWEYNNKWNKISYGRVNNKKYNVYIDSTYKGIFTLKYGSVWNLFSGNNYYSYQGNMIALSNKLSLKNMEIIDIDNKDLKEINSIIKKSYNINDITLREKIVVDLDNNGVIDKIINVSNLDGGDSSYFSLVYVVLNGNRDILINESIKESDYYSAASYSLKYLISYNNKINIIVGKGYFSLAGKSGNMMYELNQKKYELVVED